MSDNLGHHRSSTDQFCSYVVDDLISSVKSIGSSGDPPAFLFFARGASVIPGTDPKIFPRVVTLSQTGFSLWPLHLPLGTVSHSFVFHYNFFDSLLDRRSSFLRPHVAHDVVLRISQFID